MTQEEQQIKEIKERRTSECNDVSVGEAKIRMDFTYLLAALQQANKRVEALEKALILSEIGLRNCKALARKNKTEGDWIHIVRYVESALGKPSLLRGALSSESGDSGLHQGSVVGGEE